MQDNYTLYIAFKIPLTTFERQFDVYSLQTLPLPTHDDEGHVTHLSNMPPAIALSTRQTILCRHDSDGIVRLSLTF